MKIVVQNFKTGVLSVANPPAPQCGSRGILVRTRCSLISAGTDRAIIGMAKKSYLGKALDRPDLARKVINKARNDGLWATYKVVKNLIAEPIPLGYSAVGEVIAVGREINDVRIGDRVACAGLGHANHAEVISVPRNLFVPVPANVPDEQACYVTLGAIAMHGVRQADQQFGSTVLVVGLGLVGMITVQLCRAAGLRVIGTDLDTKKLAIARDMGASATFAPDDVNLAATVARMTNGHGVDAVLITAASRDSGAVFEQVAGLCRDRARVVAVGDVKMDIDRRTYFQKELEILQSRSYGPGRYDPDYEDKGQDYPIGYVRWTERRNMNAFLDLLSDNRIDMSSLTTHRFPIDSAEQGYALVTGQSSDFAIGILLDYPDAAAEIPAATPSPAIKRGTSGTIRLGVIGAGQFAKGVLLPALNDTGGFRIAGVSSARGLAAETVRKRYGAAYATSDSARLLDDPGIDAVVIASRHDSHARYVIEALRRNKHVFVEKPLCLTEAELAGIEQAAAESSAILMVGFNRRFSPLVVALRDHFAGRQEPMALSYRVNAGRIPLNSEIGWVHDPATGGGRIVGEVCHFIDTLQFITGARPVDVSAHGISIGQSNLAASDVVTLTIGFDDGSMGTVHYWSNGDGSYPKERIEGFCQQRIAILDNFRKLDLVAGNSTKTTRTMSQQKGFAEEAQAFLTACRTGKPPIEITSMADTTRTTFAAEQDLRVARNQNSGADGENV